MLNLATATNRMMQIAGYISKLLYNHDCVVIPDLGGFISNYSPAKIHPVNHTFFPPSKSILFNPKLSRDDGLLIHFIAIAEGNSYETVKEHLQEMVLQIKTQLKQGDKVTLQQVGDLYEDRSGAILFDPDETVNYLNESFGLPTFISPPIMRVTLHRRLEKSFSDRKPIPYHDRERKRNFWAYAAIIPILLALAWFILGGNFNKHDVHQSGMIHLKDSGITGSGYVPAEEKIQMPEKESTASLKELDFSESNIVTEKVDSEANNINKNPSPAQTMLPKYYIIGGAFQYKENAQNLIASLRQKGYEAADAGRNENGLFIVSYFSTSDKSEALANLSIIRKDDNPAAWLLKK